MVTDQQVSQPKKKASLGRAIRAGLDSLTVTGPSAVLESAYREAQEAVANRPSPQEREAALDQALLALDKALDLLGEADPRTAEQTVAEAYSQLKAAISGSRRS